MAAQLYLISRTESGGDSLVDGLSHAIVNADDADTDAVKIAEAEATAQAAGFGILPGYFNAVELLGPPTAGIMTTDQDAIFFTGNSTVRSIA